MRRFIVAWVVIGLPSVPAAQVGLPVAAACREPDVTIATSTPEVAVGARPEFSVDVTNTTNGPLRVLDVRNGRRNDLQTTYFELVIVKDGRVVDVPRVIADPGPVSNADFVELTPGERMNVRPLAYTKRTERLPAGEFSAFVLFWRNPFEAHTTRCRSSEVRFVVSE